MPSPLHIQNLPALSDATLLLALTGWMDGGLVSTGTVRRMMQGRSLTEVARIDPDPFYIFNFPGSMEIASVFRPSVKNTEGLITSPLEFPENVFYADPAANLAFFLGAEPNLRWQAFADAIFSVAEKLHVRRIVFIGSFGGTVPHTREPRMFGTVSHPHLRSLLEEHDFRLSDYEGPASFASLLLTQVPDHHMEMLSLVAEIPSYLQGLNPLSIEAVSRRLARILNIHVDLDALRADSTEWELKVTQAVEKDAELAGTIRKLEDRYDSELIGEPVEDEEEEEEGEGDEEEER